MLAVDLEDVDGTIDVSQLLHRLLKGQVRRAFYATRVRVAAAQSPTVKEDLLLFCIIVPSEVVLHVKDVDLARPSPQQPHQPVLEDVVAVGPDRVDEATFARGAPGTDSGEAVRVARPLGPVPPDPDPHLVRTREQGIVVHHVPTIRFEAVLHPLIGRRRLVPVGAGPLLPPLPVLVGDIVKEPERLPVGQRRPPVPAAGGSSALVVPDLAGRSISRRRRSHLRRVRNQTPKGVRRVVVVHGVVRSVADVQQQSCRAQQQQPAGADSGTR